MAIILNKPFFFLAATLAWVQVTNAQEIPERKIENIHRTENKKERLAMVYPALQLSKEQKNHLKLWQQDQKTAIAAIRDNTHLSAEQKKEAFQKLRLEQEKKRDSLLTPEQQRIWKQTRQQQKPSREVVMQDRKTTEMQEGETGKAAKRAGKKASLSPEQRKNFRNLQANYKQDLQAIEMADRLTTDQKAQKRAALQKEYHQQRLQILETGPKTGQITQQNIPIRSNNNSIYLKTKK